MKRLMGIIISCFLITLVILGANVVMEKSAVTVEESAVEKTSENLMEDKMPTEWEEYLFPEDEVIEIRIYVDEEQYDYMVENASAELYVPADIVYNGLTLKNIGIRPKGNSSLREAISAGKEQFSFKLNFDEYVSQNLYGLTSIGLNNCFSDASYIREIISYEIIEEMGLPAPGTTFCNVYINNELAGLYLSVQQIDEVFTDAWFNDGDGDLFKPEGTGADLVYIDDDYSSYSGLGERSPLDNNGEEDVVAMIKALNTGENLEDVLYVDLVLKYHALNTAMLSLDGYMGGMFHNYYLYGEDGTYMIIPWDYNMSFGGFGMSTNQTSEDGTLFYIDEPTSGAMENYPLINTLLSNEDYLEQYHEYLTELIEGPLEIEGFTARAEELMALVDEYIKNDPEPISSYEAFQSALYDMGDATSSETVEKIQRPEVLTENNSKTEDGQQAMANENIPNTEEQVQGFMKERGGGGMANAPALLTFVESWTENIQKQLSGELASTNNGEGSNSGRMSQGNMGVDRIQEKMQGMFANGEAPGTGFDPSAMMNMEGGNRPQMRERPSPPDGMQMDEDFPEPPNGMDAKAMKPMFKNEEGVPGAVDQSSMGFNLVGADASKYILIIILALFVMLFAWLIKRKS